MQIIIPFIETVRNLYSSSNTSVSNDGKNWEGRQIRESVEVYSARRHPRQRSSVKRRIMPQPNIPIVLGPSKHSAEALALSSSLHGSGELFIHTKRERGAMPAEDSRRRMKNMTVEFSR
ncbi:unnamed protein product [Rodentolepis nana]|uniref:Uncharacterized protein n=1 Tax=Rodentolepis nana TaxID=102285 RepID=A0A3P7T365_RODNA|nr:unnamed protein product [Rodentolepis nana]